MVDGVLPLERDPRPLRSLFLDFNSYFASVEQQEHPELRGKPVAVAPVDTDSTSCIAASYEARRFGVKCGTNVGEARRMCPGLIVVHGKHHVYDAYHRRIVEVVGSLLPIDKEHSIDEMSFRLMGEEQAPGRAHELALEMKRRLRDRVGECMTCSVGIAPNAFLAKVATEVQKPNGLVVLQAQDLPGRLRELKIIDFAGINRKMQARLNAHGIFSVEALYAASKRELALAFGSIVGERWWYLLRGYELPNETNPRRTYSHSHVLPPALRTAEGAYRVLTRLLYKAAMRLRQDDHWTEGMEVSVKGMRRSWRMHTSLSPSQDSMTLTDALAEMWASSDFLGPLKVGLTLYGLKRTEAVTPSLFDERDEERRRLSESIDRMNARFGKLKVYPATIHKVRNTAEERIAFAKTQLISEGAGDDEWRPVFQRLMAHDPVVMGPEYVAGEEPLVWSEG